MKLDKSIVIVFIISCCTYNTFSQVLGIDNLSEYLPFLKNKNIGLVVNHTSKINEKHLVDTLISLDVSVKYIFSPEHGFSGSFDAGESFNDSIYNDTIPIISLYTNKKINNNYSNTIDLMLFDIQDVGVRFYTYISTLHYVMEFCAEHNIKLIVLDRPNPHTHYVDGPVLDLEFKSFVGMHPVPVVYGMTIGEYALMINGEGWLKNQINCDLYIVKNTNYVRNSIININIPPSPNLRNMNAVFLYPSLCFFEGTIISVGRGTDTPFEIYGAPFFKTNFSFIPSSTFGAKSPKFQNEICYGFDLKKGLISDNYKNYDSLNLQHLINAYQQTPNEYKVNFFNSFFSKLAGNSHLQKDIINGLSFSEIKLNWQEDIADFLLIRKKYLLYD